MPLKPVATGFSGDLRDAQQSSARNRDKQMANRQQRLTTPQKPRNGKSHPKVAFA
jgi:hypothetical protein